MQAPFSSRIPSFTLTYYDIQLFRIFLDTLWRMEHRIMTSRTHACLFLHFFLIFYYFLFSLYRYHFLDRRDWSILDGLVGGHIKRGSNNIDRKGRDLQKGNMFDTERPSIQ